MLSRLILRGHLSTRVIRANPSRRERAVATLSRHRVPLLAVAVPVLTVAGVAALRRFIIR